MGKIFYIMGKSASGKDRIYSLLAAHKELNLKTLILYTTRPIRVGEQDGKNYYFVDDGKLEEFRKNGNLIEERAYHTVYGIWTYFTADDGQVNLADSDYLGIGTLESFKKMRKYEQKLGQEPFLHIIGFCMLPDRLYQDPVHIAVGTVEVSAQIIQDHAVAFSGQEDPPGHM